MAAPHVGTDTYKGMAVPLYGESVIHQQNSSNCILSLMHTSANAGRFLMCMDYKDIESQDATSLLTDLAVADVDAGGGFRAVSGTSVKMELNSSGLFAGGESSKLIDPVYGYRINTQRFSTVAAATTNVAATTADAGILYHFTTQRDLSFLTLPATPRKGDFFDVFSNSSAAQSVRVKGAATGDTQGFYIVESSGDHLTTAAVAPNTSGTFYARFTAVTSGGLYAVQPFYMVDNTSTVDGQIVEATTSS